MSPAPSDPNCLVLLLDPQPASARLLAAALQRWGHAATSDAARLRDAGLVLLDPACDGGWPRLRQLRAATRVPLIAMLDGDDPLDRVLALESGADALIARPVELRELRARMLLLLARHDEQSKQASAEPAAALSFGRWRVEPATRRLVGPGGFAVPLSPAEYRLLRAFLERPRSVLRRQDLIALSSVGDAGPEAALERSIDLLISRLRSKLNEDARDPQHIRTVRGIGYLFDDSLR